MANVWIIKTLKMQNEYFNKIESPENPKIKYLKKLCQKKYRKQEGFFLIENATTIFDGLKKGYFFETLFFTKAFFEKNKELLNFIIQKSETKEIFQINEKINKHYSNLENPSGITAVYKKRKNKHTDGPVVFLNNINDPGNIGTILRTSFAFGFKNIVIDKFSAEIYNPKTLQASKDSIFSLNIYEDGDINWLKKFKDPIYTTSSKNGTDLQKIKTQKNFCLVFGNETRGIDEEIQKLAKQKIKIEMKEELESLNVAISASIILYSLSK